MTVKRIYRDGRVRVQVQHKGIKLEDYTYSRENAHMVELRLVSLAEHLAPIAATQK